MNKYLPQQVVWLSLDFEGYSDYVFNMFQMFNREARMHFNIIDDKMHANNYYSKNLPGAPDRTRDLIYIFEDFILDIRDERRSDFDIMTTELKLKLSFCMGAPRRKRSNSKIHPIKKLEEEVLVGKMFIAYSDIPIDLPNKFPMLFTGRSYIKLNQDQLPKKCLDELTEAHIHPMHYVKANAFF